MAIAQIMNRIYKMCVLFTGRSHRAEQDPESKTRAMREPGMALDRGPKNPRERVQC